MMNRMHPRSAPRHKNLIERTLNPCNLCGRWQCSCRGGGSAAPGDTGTATDIVSASDPAGFR